MQQLATLEKEINLYDTTAEEQLHEKSFFFKFRIKIKSYDLSPNTDPLKTVRSPLNCIQKCVVIKGN